MHFFSGLNLRSKDCSIKANIKNGNMIFEAEKTNFGNYSDTAKS